MIWLYIIIFIISAAALLKAGSLAVKKLSKIAQFLKLSEFMVAFVLMALATTMPEMFVGITSALSSRPALSFGNVIGSNIINLTLLVAIITLLASPLRMESKSARRNTVYTGLVGTLPLLLILDRSLSRFDGLILILGFILYFYRLSSEREKFKKIFQRQTQEEMALIKSFFKDCLLFILAVSLLLLSAQGIVFSSTYLAQAMGISLFIIGIIVVALGTNLPELVFSIKAVRAGHKEMALGDLMGAVAVNSSLVLGITVLISPFKIVSFAPYSVGIVFTWLALFLFFIFSRTGRAVSKKEALLLLLTYFAFIIFQILIK